MGYSFIDHTADVAADGVVSPGGVGYDINCGVRLLRSSLTRQEIAPHVEAIVTQMYNNVPTGVGAHRTDLRVIGKNLRQVLETGAAWAVSKGLGRAEDLDTIKERGCIAGADPELVSDRAEERGQRQLGTLGSGNHFAELQYVAEIFDERIASAFGLAKDQITVMIHSGSRGLGHQVCTDHLRVMAEASRKGALLLCHGGDGGGDRARGDGCSLLSAGCGVGGPIIGLPTCRELYENHHRTDSAGVPGADAGAAPAARDLQGRSQLRRD